MPAITVTDLNNAKLDTDTIAAIATSQSLTITDRLGNVKSTTFGAIQTLKAFNVRGVWATATAYALKDVYTFSGYAYVVVAAHTSTTVAADLTSGYVTIHQGVTREDIAASTGAGFVGFVQAGTGAVTTTVQNVLRETVSVKRFGAVGDGITDDTAAIQACYAASAGKNINHGDGFIYLVSASLTLYSGASYTGKSVIKAKAGANIAGAILSAISCTNIVIDGLECDANTDNAGSIGAGIYFKSGSSNKLINSYVHDTNNAGLQVEEEDNFLGRSNRIINCGRTGVANNHGIMIGANTNGTTCKNWLLEGNLIVNAFRKGLTTYAFNNSTCVNGRIIGNVILSCLLGGIYIAGDVNTFDRCTDIVIAGNVSKDNYVNYEFANCSRVTANGNTSTYTSAATAAGKDSGWSVQGVNQISIVGGTVDMSPVHGIKVLDAGTQKSIGVVIKGVVVTRSNQTSAATGCGIVFTNTTTYSSITGCIISDSTGKMTQGILENAGSDYNAILDNQVKDATSSNILTSSANTVLRTVTGNLTGLNTAIPLNTLDINGGLTIREQFITLASGANQNVVLPAGAGQLISSTPSAAYSFGGIAGGHSGRRLTIFNYTGSVMTLNHQDAGSLAANRFLLANNTALAVPTLGAVEIVYSQAAGGWVKVG